MRATAALAVGFVLATAGVAHAEHSWLLPNKSQFVLAAPPAASAPETHRDLATLRALQRSRTASGRAAVRRWTNAPAVVPWTRVALRMIRLYRPRPSFSARALGLFETAMSDAWTAASVHPPGKRPRPAPGALDPKLHPLRARSARGAPDAAVAGAAERILPVLFTEASPAVITKAADEATQALLVAGVAYPGDVARARELGQRVGDLAVARANADGHLNPPPPADPFAATPENGGWVPTPPSFETPIGAPVGAWRPWVLSSPSALRDLLPGPSPYGSPEFMRQLLTVLDTNLHLTEEQRQIATLWDDAGGTLTPPGHWFDIAIGLVRSYHLAPGRTARTFAALGVAEADAAIAFFEAKYHWRSIRPVTAVWRLCPDRATLCGDSDSNPYRGNWLPYIGTPPFPSYPSGHSTFSGAAATVLSATFPQARKALNRLADEAAMSRLYGGIHYPEDNRDGLVLGRAVGAAVVRRNGG